MWRPGRIDLAWLVKVKSLVTSASRRDQLAMLLVVATIAGIALALSFSKGTQLLMPGPLTSGHGAIENCSACHTRSGSTKLSWLHGLVAGNPLADSEACLTCHKMPDTAFNAHSASSKVLRQSTKRLKKTAARSVAPLSARLQGAAFPMADVVTGDLYCATCHQEHQGTSFNLNKISNEQCRSCHVVQFDSFDGQHPKFENFPFKRRTRIIYDHAEHFGKHFPEVAKKEPSKRIPATCATCHNSEGDRRVMAVVPFDQTCTTCHLNQIIGKERVSGPKGVAFLTLPGLDLETLEKKKAAIGEWPDAAEGGLTPFMKMMIGRNEQGRDLLKAVERLDLQDLSKANDAEIKAVSKLAWEVKGVFYALIKGKASDVLGDLNIGGGARPSATLVTDLTASIPRDAVTGAQLEWLPNLASEMEKRQKGSASKQAGESPEKAGSESAAPELAEAEPAGEPAAAEVPQENSGSSAKAAAGEEPAAASPEVGTAGAGVGLDAVCADGGLDETKVASTEAKAAVPEGEAAEAESSGEETLYDGNGAVAVNGRLLLQSGTPRAIKARAKGVAKKAAGNTETAEVSGGKESLCAEAESQSVTGDQVAAAVGENDVAEAKTTGDNEAPVAAEQSAGQETEQFDDLLFPDGGGPDSNKAAKTAESPEDAEVTANEDGEAASDAPPGPEAAGSDASAAPVISIESDVDPESWAEYGGWYRQDYGIFYRPIGHKDKFIYSWLTLTGAQATNAAASPAAAVFDYLTGKEAQGSCTKCHSVDDNKGRGRVVNFIQPSVKSKQGRFTRFVHEPHMSVMDKRGCLSCHELEKGRPYLKSFEQGNPQKFVSGFGPVKKELCQTCHAAGKARQDCLLCHQYHVNGATMPVMNTKFPVQ